MRKLFLAICFILLATIPAWADIQQITDINQAKKNAQVSQVEQMKKNEEFKNYIQNMSAEEIDNFLKNRMKQVIITNIDETSGLAGDGAINVQKSQEMIEKEAWEKKSFFEKIYEKSLNSIIDTSQPQPKASLYTDKTDENINIQPQAADDAQIMNAYLQQQKQALLKQNINLIEVPLPPYNTKTLVPAMEHIPYLFSKIEILPDGLLHITDTVIVVANNNKVKNPLTRVFPKYAFDRENQRQKLDFNLASVTINGEEINYKIEDQNNYVFFVPEENILLKPGVYEFSFDYTVDNQIFAYDNFDEFYWNVTGSSWNMVVAKAGALVVLPPKSKPLGQMALSGYDNLKTDKTILISQEGENMLGFVSTAPLFLGQGFEIIISLPQDSILPPSLNKHFLRLINAYGDVIFSSLGLLFILSAYLISWRYIQKNRKKAQNFTQNAYLLRYFNIGKIDTKIFGIFLLNLFKKNIIDIEKNDDNFLLIKKSDNLAPLSRLEKKALNVLFAKDEAILNLNSYAKIKIERAFLLLKKFVTFNVHKLLLKLNLGYFALSLMMLVVAEAAIALLSYNFIYNFSFLLLSSVLFAFYLWIFQKKFAKPALNLTAKILAGFLTAATFFTLLAVVNLMTAILLFATVWIIQKFSILYVQKDGLTQTYIAEAKKYKDLLLKQADAFSVGKDFLNRQAAIYALDCEEKYSANELIKPYYKLDILAEINKKISSLF